MDYTDQAIQDLRNAFERVQNSDHWKGPIDATVGHSEGFTEKIISDAVMFFTATEATISDDGMGDMHVIAAGYWEGPAN